MVGRRVVFGLERRCTRVKIQERRPSRTAVSPHLGAGEKSQQRDSEPELTGPQLLLLSFFFTICRPAVVAVVWVRVHPSRFIFLIFW